MFKLVTMVLSRRFVALVGRHSAIFVPIVALSLASALPFLTLGLHRITPIISNILFTLCPLYLVKLFVSRLCHEGPGPFTS